MSDNILFDIQTEIIKKVSDVKSLIRFRSVSKPWKSFIDSSQFIKGYGACHTQPHSRILGYTSHFSHGEAKYFCLVDDDIETFKVQQQELAPFVMSPLLKQYHVSSIVGACHGLLCLYGVHEGYNKRMFVIWNPSIGKSFGIASPIDYSQIPTVYGFGVCPVAKDPTIVKIKHTIGMPWHVEVFTLSSGVWNVIPSGNLPRQTIRLVNLTHAVIDRFIYWAACEKTFIDDGEDTTNYMVVSFDMITKEFKVVELPDSLTNEIISNGARVSVSKLRECLVVYGSINVEGAKSCGVWVMQHDSSFKKLFSIGARVDKIFGFRESGEPIIETEFESEDKKQWYNTLDVYDPCTQQIYTLGFDNHLATFGMCLYKESLLLLDHSDLHIYRGDNL